MDVRDLHLDCPHSFGRAVSTQWTSVQSGRGRIMRCRASLPIPSQAHQALPRIVADPQAASGVAAHRC
jgi:hypothetical protein